MWIHLTCTTPGLHVAFTTSRNHVCVMIHLQFLWGYDTNLSFISRPKTAFLKKCALNLTRWPLPWPIIQGFPRDFSRCENPAGFHGIRDNPVIPWNFENPVPVQADPVEMFTIPIPSGAFFEVQIPCKLVPWNLSVPKPVLTSPVVSWHRGIYPVISDTTGFSWDFWCRAQRLDVLNSKAGSHAFEPCL